MKNILFTIIVILLIPVYICLIMGKKTIEISIDIISPVIEGIEILIEDMTEFWKKIFKFGEEK